MEFDYKKYEKKNKITGIILLLLLTIFLLKVTYGLSIICFIYITIYKFKVNKKGIQYKKQLIKEKHDNIK